MKIIDGRLRPPYRSIKNEMMFDPAFSIPFNANYGMSFPKSAQEKSMELLFEEMEQTGIEKGLLPFRRMCDQGVDNQDYYQMQKDYPDKFIGFAGLYPTAGVEKALHEIDELVINGPFYGIALEPGLDKWNWRVDDWQMYPIYKKCEAENIPVYFTWGGLCANPAIYEPEMIDRVARDFPEMRMLLGHTGFPRSAEHCCVAINRPNVYLGVDLYVVNAPGAQDLITAANYRLQDQIVFGSAYPFMDVNEAVNYYLQAGFREEVLEKLFYQNAAKFAGIL